MASNYVNSDNLMVCGAKWASFTRSAVEIVNYQKQEFPNSYYLIFVIFTSELCVQSKDKSVSFK